MSSSMPDNWLAKTGLHIFQRHERVIRFLIVGLLNTSVGYTLFTIVFLLTGWHRFAIIAATILGVLFNFFSLGYMVFGNLTARALLPFVLGYGVTLSINILALEVLINWGLHPLLAQALMLPFIALMVYSINSRFVFKKGS
jgi:putative flippase GtrA